MHLVGCLSVGEGPRDRTTVAAFFTCVRSRSSKIEVPWISSSSCWCCVVAGEASSLVFLLGLGVAAGVSYAMTPKYESTAKVIVSVNASNATEASGAAFFLINRVQSYADLADSTELAAAGHRDARPRHDAGRAVGPDLDRGGHRRRPSSRSPSPTRTRTRRRRSPTSSPPSSRPTPRRSRPSARTASRRSPSTCHGPAGVQRAARSAPTGSSTCSPAA